MEHATAIAVDSVELSDRTCWVLGAGASFDCIGADHSCVPLTRDLIENSPITDRLHELLRDLVKYGELTATSAEEALGQRIEITVDELRGLSLEGRSVERRAKAADTLGELIRVIAAMVSVGSIGAMYEDEEGFRAENYAWLAFQSSRFPFWSIVTLNYDNVLDWAFEFLINFVKRSGDREMPSQYINWTSLLDTISSRKEPHELQFDSGLFLKVHGCLELCSCQNVECERYRVPFRPEPKALRQPHFFGSRDVKCQACGSQAANLILPPGRNKTPAEDVYHRSVYSLAEGVASESSPWLCLGYSCPEYDRDVTDFLRGALLERRKTGRETSVYVVSPDPLGVAQRLSDRLDHCVYAYSSTFTDLVAGARRSGRITKDVQR